jgi:phosphate transport system permease protein
MMRAMTAADKTQSASEARLQGQLAHRRLRFIKDKIAYHGVTLGGLSVIAAITLIFFYLLYVVIPLLQGVDIEQKAKFPAPAQGKTLALSLEEQAEIGIRLTDAGHAIFFGTETGEVVDDIALPIARGTTVTSIARGEAGKNIFALGLSNGRALVFQIKYGVTFPNNVRLITPRIEYPLGDKTIKLNSRRKPVVKIAVQQNDESATVVSVSDSQVALTHFSKGEGLLDEDGTWQQNNVDLPSVDGSVDYVLLDPDQRRLYLADTKGVINFFDTSNKQEPKVIERITLTKGKVQLTTLEFLSGSISLIAGFSDGRLAQWFPVRDEQNIEHLKEVRSFRNQRSGMTRVATEYFRKGFLAADTSGNIGVYHATAERNLTVEQVSDEPISQLAIAPRSNAMLVEDNIGNISFWRIHNEHPEVSWSSLWGKVWYEGYDEPKHIWQSSSASNDFEPKFSLTPLAFGTLKAAFYAMIVAIPLSIFGAVFTAYFMAPRMRQYVKPTIEIMEALPTVILGFLAGLWLAPYLEKHLPGIFALLIIMPVGVVLFSYLWSRLPGKYRHLVPEGWQGALLLPIVFFLGWLALAASGPMEDWFFGGDMPLWLSNELGVNYDQRNAIVVGLAMGFAVIPTIFSIAEDAIFAVPRHLTNGSLALGATPWQTLIRVVLLTASPGIFSAIMIGMGRAVGETMIVLMATGNTPVLDLSMFQGMRTLSANIAVEMPESELNSTHYRVLFLAGLVLFLFTFMFNTMAEVIRQRLRTKYSSL